MAETTVFQSGNSQAVRLPKEFRFQSKTVEIFRRGNEIVLREKPRTLGELLDSLPPVTDEEARQMDAVLAAIRAPMPPDTRDWSWLEAADRPVTSPSGSRPGRKAAPGRKAG